MKTKYYRQDNRIVRCSDLKRFKHKEEFLEEEVENLERQLEEAREFKKRIKHHCQAFELSGLAWSNMDRICNEVEQLKEQK